MAGKSYVVCSASELEIADHVVVQVGARQLGVFEVAGEYFALPSVCPHQNGPLCRGAVTGTVVADQSSDWRPYWIKEGEVVSCPWHSMEFDIRSGVCLANSRFRVPVYPARAVDGQIVVELPR
jgi:nitrite reductase/ring-hydroxylating ferredoxin subunit